MELPGLYSVVIIVTVRKGGSDPVFTFRWTIIISRKVSLTAVTAGTLCITVTLGKQLEQTVSAYSSPL